MSHAKRIHVPGGTYYAMRRSKPPHAIFLGPRDYEEFEDFLTIALQVTGMKLLAYCWMPDSIHLALAIGRTPVSELMRRITRYCSQRMRKRSAVNITPFSANFPITLVDPEAYLPSLIQYIHYVPVLAGIAATPNDYPYTSHWAYLGMKRETRVDPRALVAVLRNQGGH